MSYPEPHQLVRAYRNLYRNALHAVQYSKPGRFVVRDQLRKAFRDDDPSAFDQTKIDRTVDFLRLAAKERGLEHKILKNLVHVEHLQARTYLLARKDRTPMQKMIRKTSRTHYDMTLTMLNETMGLCLR